MPDDLPSLEFLREEPYSESSFRPRTKSLI